MTPLNLVMALLGVAIGYGIGRHMGYREGSSDERRALVSVIREMRITGGILGLTKGKNE